MACLESNIKNNFLNWNKVSGALTLSQLQSIGLPSICDNISQVIPGTPSNLVATAVSVSEIQLTWDVVTGADTYNVYRSTTELGAYTLISSPATNSYNNTGLTASTTYYYKVSSVQDGVEGALSGAVNASTYSTLLTDIVAYYRLDESSGAVIDAVLGNNGVNNGATPNVTGKIETAYEFDGLVDYVNIDALVTPLATTTQGTWNCWVKPVDATPLAGQQILAFGDTSAIEFVILSISSIPTLQMNLNKSGTNQWLLRSDVNPFSDNIWSMITIVQDGISPILYVNGVAVAQTFSISTDKTAWFNDLTGVDNGRLGDINYGGFGEGNFFEGTIDEVGIWDRALTSDEITELYNSSDGSSYPF